jgi:hypothetical protein
MSKNKKWIKFLKNEKMKKNKKMNWRRGQLYLCMNRYINIYVYTGIAFKCTYIHPYMCLSIYISIYIVHTCK